MCDILARIHRFHNRGSVTIQSVCLTNCWHRSDEKQTGNNMLSHRLRYDITVNHLTWYYIWMHIVRLMNCTRCTYNHVRIIYKGIRCGSVVISCTVQPWLDYLSTVGVYRIIIPDFWTYFSSCVLDQLFFAKLRICGLSPLLKCQEMSWGSQ